MSQKKEPKTKEELAQIMRELLSTALKPQKPKKDAGKNKANNSQ